MRSRRVSLFLAILLFMFTSLVSPVRADTGSSIGISVNNIVSTDSITTVNSNGIAMVPALEFARAIGGSFTFDSTSMTGTVKLSENELVFRLDNQVVRFNGKYIQAPVPMKILNCRFMVPADFVSRTLGLELYTNTRRNMLMVFGPVNGNLVYNVLPGDSLWAITQLFGVPISTIMQLNSLTSSMLYVGQKLVIKPIKPANPVVSAKIVNGATLRSGPGFGYAIVGYLAASAGISVTGKNGEWYKADTPKGSAYIYSSVVKVSQELSDNAADSTYFSNEIPVDTSNDSISYSQYTVQKGDTVWSIAEQWGIPYTELITANSMTSSSVLYPGQALKIPVHNIAVRSKSGPQYGEVLDWFREGQYVFPIGKTGKLIDLETGKSFMVRRTIGASHSDTETLTAQDTQTMKEIFGGSWTWNRRSFILEVDARQFAVSVAGMPHAGVDGVPFLQNVDGRSDNWGYGPNYDAIPGNDMDGHFDVYFLNSLKHVDNELDPGHQYSVMVAGGLR